MQYLAKYIPGTDHDKRVFNEVRRALSIKCNCVLFKDEDECKAVFEEIKKQLYYYTVEWLNGFDNPLEDDVVLSVSRGKHLTYSIGTVHFFKCKRTFTPNLSTEEEDGNDSVQ